MGRNGQHQQAGRQKTTPELHLPSPILNSTGAQKFGNQPKPPALSLGKL
jgi:hypothetical protein